MLIELAEDRRMPASAGSAKARLTIAWQSSNLPSTAKVVTLPPSVVICLRWRSRDLGDREQHDDLDARHAVVGVGHGAAGVARGGGEDDQLARAPRP